MTAGSGKKPIVTATRPEPATTGRREVSVLLATRGMVLVLGVLTQSLLAYALLPEGRGAYAVCVLFGDLAGVMVTLGSGRGAQYFVMTNRLSVSQAMSVAFTFCLIGSAVAAIAAIPLIHSGLDFFLNADTSSFHTAILLIPTCSLAFATVLQLEGLRRFGRLALFSFLRSAVGAVAIVVLVWMLDLGVDGAVLALALAHLAMAVACITDLRRHCGLILELPSREGLREVLRYGIKEYPARIGQAVDYRVGSLLLGMVAGRADIGLFTAGIALITRLLLIPTAVSTYLLPRVAADGDGSPRLVAFCARVTWWAVGGLLLVWFAVSTHLVPLLLSEAFTPVVHLTWIMSVGVLAYSGTEVFVAYFRGMNRPQVFSWAMWIGLAANVVLFFALYPAWGLLHGAAWAFTGALLCRSFILWAVFQRTTRLPVSATLLLRRADVAHLWTSTLNLARDAGVRRT